MTSKHICEHLTELKTELVEIKTNIPSTVDIGDGNTAANVFITNAADIAPSGTQDVNITNTDPISVNFTNTSINTSISNNPLNVRVNNSNIDNVNTYVNGGQIAVTNAALDQFQYCFYGQSVQTNLQFIGGQNIACGPGNLNDASSGNPNQLRVNIATDDVNISSINNVLSNLNKTLGDCRYNGIGVIQCFGGYVITTNDDIVCVFNGYSTSKNEVGPFSLGVSKITHHAGDEGIVIQYTALDDTWDGITGSGYVTYDYTLISGTDDMPGPLIYVQNLKLRDDQPELTGLLAIYSNSLIWTGAPTSSAFLDVGVRQWQPHMVQIPSHGWIAFDHMTVTSVPTGPTLFKLWQCFVSEAAVANWRRTCLYSIIVGANTTADIDLMNIPLIAGSTYDSNPIFFFITANTFTQVGQAHAKCYCRIYINNTKTH